MKYISTSFVFLTLIGIISCSTPHVEEDEQNPDAGELGETITVSQPRVEGEEIIYNADGINLIGYIAYDDNQTEPKPGIIVVHEWWGHNAYVRKRAEMLAELGYVAMALDMYGNGKTAEHPDDAGAFSQAVMQNMDTAQARFFSALQTLKQHPKTDSTKIAAIGYCFGGSVVMTMANAGYDLDGVAAFHSGVQLPIMPSEETTKAQFLVCNGADDPFISEESITAFKTAMDEANVDYEYHSYEGAVHAFTNPAADTMGSKFEMPLAYNKEADEQSWDELQDFLNEIFEE